MAQQRLRSCSAALLKQTVLLALLAAACATDRAIQKPGQDGMSADTAVEVTTIDGEYKWLRNHPCAQGGAWQPRIHQVCLMR